VRPSGGWALSDATVSTITIPTPFAIGAVNGHLLQGPPLTLVDAGPNSSEALSALEEGLGARGLAVADLELLVLTHQHLDHFGLAARIQELSGCTVATHELLADYLVDFPASHEAEHDYQAEVMRLHGVADDAIETIRAVSSAYQRFGGSVAVERRLADGDVLEIGEHSFRALLRPGHSPTDTIFVDDDARLAVVGDHLLKRISSNPVVHRPRTGDADPKHRSSSLLAYIDSLEQTAALELDVLLTGHGEPIDDHRALVASRIQHHRERADQVLEHLSDSPGTAYSVARRIWGDVALRQAYLTLTEVLGAIDLLLEDARVTEHFDGVIFTYAAAAKT
jgi:glyoxylase-like metal-dependent hydrolase (beta-lactamase superfamily II)